MQDVDNLTEPFDSSNAGFRDSYLFTIPSISWLVVGIVGTVLGYLVVGFAIFSVSASRHLFPLAQALLLIVLYVAVVILYPVFCGLFTYWTRTSARGGLGLTVLLVIALANVGLLVYLIQHFLQVGSI